MEKCLICPMKTGNIELDEGVPVCHPCAGKYGDKLRDKLVELEVLDDVKVEEKETEPFKCSLKYSGGTKADIIHLIAGLMDTEDISIEDVEAGVW